MERTRPGYSLSDLLAVMMVIGILLMISLGALLHSREAGRRASCLSNFKQIAAALQNYQATHGSYPLGVTASYNTFTAPENAGKPSGQPTDWSGWSAHALMLGFLDQTPLYNALNFDFDPYVSAAETAFNTTALATKVAVFLCPNDPYTGQMGVNSVNNYYASTGTVIQNKSHQPTGVFGYQFLCRSSDITDGESNTIAFSEGIAGNHQARRYRGNGVVNVGATFAESDNPTAERNTDQLMQNLQACHDAFNAVAARPFVFTGDRGHRWAWGAESMTLFNTIVPPNSSQYVFNQCRYDCRGCFLDDADHSDITNASSFHPGGAYALFCDGAVRFMRSSISIQTWWALGTRRGGEAVSAHSF
jgi:prepilin-type processing-associated H-X9-DG protein